jgi:acetyl-CoA/propionyl-CoA carboxylase biotin carboxyl carrier protein
MEAMKMETQVTAARSGRVRFKAEGGAYLQAGTEIARFEA